LTPETERKIAAWIPAIAYIGLIFGVSSIAGLSPPVPTFKLFDKAAHIVEFTGLALFLTVAFRGSLPEARRRATPLFVVALGLAIGVLDEVYQLSVPGRSLEFLDWVADAIGVLIGATAGALHGRFAARARVRSAGAGAADNERRRT
jgi:VanZ family protein